MAAVHQPNITVPIMASQSPPSGAPKYTESFENEAMRALLNLPTAPTQITDPSASPAPVLPFERPLPLTDSRRTQPLSHTNISVTEPGGSVYGGAGASKEELLSEAQKIVDENGIKSEFGIKTFLARKVEALEDDAAGIARKRLEALEANARVEKEIRVLEQQYEMEKRAMLKSAGMNEK